MRKYHPLLPNQKFTLPLLIIGALFLALVITLNVSQQRQESRGRAATVFPGYYKLVNKATGKVIAVGGSSQAENAKVIEWTDKNIADQQWSITDVGGGYYHLINRNSGKLMRILNASTADGALVVQHSEQAQTVEQWSLVAVSGNDYQIINRSTGKALTVPSGQSAAVQQPYTGATNQRFTLVSVTNPSSVQKVTVMPYLSTGYKYKVVAQGAEAGFEQQNYNTTTFSNGDGGFGIIGGGCPLNTSAYVKTNWSINTDILVRKEFTVPSGVSDLWVGVAVDNDVQVFINGQDISHGMKQDGLCPFRDQFVFEIPSNILNTGGANLLAIRARDRGLVSYLDATIEGNVIQPTPTPTNTPTPTRTPTPTATPTKTPTPTPTLVTKTCTFISDTSNTVVGGGNAVALTPKATWTASIPGATWIWSSLNVTSPTVQETKTFAKSMYVKLPVAQAKLDIAADNNYRVSLNGTQIFADTSDTGSSSTPNFSLAGQDSYTFNTNFIDGINVFNFSAINLGIPNSTPQTNPAGLLYKLTVTAADCGNEAPNTKLSLNLFLHGLGKAGDAANPGVGGNANPLRPQRTVTVQVFNAQNQLVATKQGQVTYDQASGSFKGTVDIGIITNGIYTVKVKTDQFLNTLISGIQTLNAGATVQMPTTSMINGDINNDNVLNILDYDILLGCYSDFQPAVSCTTQSKLMADLNDDGAVNQFDYNLFLRELTNVSGK